MNSSSNKTRITYKSATPNPLFLQWLQELQADATARGSNSQYAMKEAIKSLKRYPVPVRSGAECAILKGFGKKLCAYLDSKLTAHTEFVLPSSSNARIVTPLRSRNEQTAPEKSNAVNLLDEPKSSKKVATTKRDKPIKPYKPANRSGGCAILLALMHHVNENPDKLSLTKDAVIEKAQHLCEESFTRPKPDSRYTAWSSMARLITKGLVNKARSKKVEFSLTDEGFMLATELYNEYKDRPTTVDLMSDNFGSFESVPSTSKSDLAFSSQTSGSGSSISNGGPTNPSSRQISNGGQTSASGPISYGSQNSVSSPISYGSQTIANGPKSSSASGPISYGSQASSSRSQISYDRQISAGSQISYGSSQTYAGSQAYLGSQISYSSQTSASGSIEVDDETTDAIENIVEMPVGSFDVILLIDKAETSGASKKNDATVVQFNKYAGLKHEYRHLKVGDFTWVARHRTTGRELVLPYIVERKRMDDLGASIKDGRFHEQKFRLKKCGLSNVIYLIENYGKNKLVGLPVQSLMQAIANTRVQSGFKVHTTDSLADSARFLAILTKRLTIEYKDKSLRGRSKESSDEYLMTFDYFNKASTKTKPLTVTETFIKMLLQLRGMSVEKALAITQVYKTPKSLIEKYKACSQKEGETLIANLKYDEDSRKVGPSISKSIHQLFTLNILP